MSTERPDALKMQVRESETGLVRLFAVDLPTPDALALRNTPEAVPPMLGVATLQEEQWELFDLADLAGLGLEGYLSEGHGIAETELEPHRWTLDALEGVVFILRSAALAERPVTLTPRAPLRWVATFGEVQAPVPIRADLPNASARGMTGGPAAAGKRPRSSILLLVLGLVLTGAVALGLYLLTAAPT